MRQKTAVIIVFLVSILGAYTFSLHSLSQWVITSGQEGHQHFVVRTQQITMPPVDLGNSSWHNATNAFSIKTWTATIDFTIDVIGNITFSNGTSTSDLSMFYAFLNMCIREHGEAANLTCMDILDDPTGSLLNIQESSAKYYDILFVYTARDDIDLGEHTCDITMKIIVTE